MIRKETAKIYSYETIKIELLAGTLVDTNSTNSNTNNSITSVILLNEVKERLSLKKRTIFYSLVCMLR